MSYDRSVEAFRQHTAPDPTSLSRLQRSLRQHTGAPPPRRSRRALAVAAALVLAVGAGGLLLLSSKEPPTPLSAPLSAATMEQAQLTPLVQASLQGDGALSGDTQSPRIDWQHGTLRLSVVPEQGIDLRVQTPDARVRVVGTVFTVEADRMGTEVRVERGEVEVTCAGSEPASLTTDQTQFCWPQSAARLLNRVTAQSERGASAADILETISRGLAAPDLDALTAAQLRYRKIELLGQQGRFPEAAAESRAFLKSSPPLHAEAVQAYLTTLEAAGY